MAFWKSISDLLNYSAYNVNLGRIAAAVVAVVLILGVRGLLTKAVFTVARRFTARTATSFDDNVLDILFPPVRFLFIPLAVWAAAAILAVPEDAATVFDHLIRSLIIIAVVWAAYRAATGITDYLEPLVARTETRIDDHLLPIVRKAIRFLVVVLGVVTLIQEWGYDVGAILAGLGLGGLAFALAARDTVSNLFGCVMILTDRPFNIGDWIKTPSVEGTVEEIGFRSTKVRTFAQALVTVPNATLANESIVNWSRMGKRRITFTLGVTYGTSRRQMEACLKNIDTMLREHPAVHEQTIFVQFDGFGDSSLNIFIYFFTKTTVWGEYLAVRTEINLKILKILEDLGVSCAFPSRSLYVESTPAADETLRLLNRLADG